MKISPLTVQAACLLNLFVPSVHVTCQHTRLPSTPLLHPLLCLLVLPKHKNCVYLLSDFLSTSWWDKLFLACYFQGPDILYHRREKRSSHKQPWYKFTIIFYKIMRRCHQNTRAAHHVTWESFAVIMMTAMPHTTAVWTLAHAVWRGWERWRLATETGRCKSAQRKDTTCLIWH